MQNKVVVHREAGELVKGITNNFFPNKEKFHVTDDATGEVLEVAIDGLKAVFFVKDLKGSADHRERTETERTGFGKKIQVEFNDGETLLGYSQGYVPGRRGFFVFPVDPDSNNERIFVVTAATRNVHYL